MENTDIKIIINGIIQTLKEKNGFKDSTIKRHYHPGFSFIIHLQDLKIKSV